MHALVSQITCASGLLDAVAQLLQQTRTQLASALPHDASSGAAAASAAADAMDELLFLTYLQVRHLAPACLCALGVRRPQQLRLAHALRLAAGTCMHTYVRLLHPALCRAAGAIQERQLV
jgi:hypothetical protein